MKLNLGNIVIHHPTAHLAALPSEDGRVVSSADSMSCVLTGSLMSSASTSPGVGSGRCCINMPAPCDCSPLSTRPWPCGACWFWSPVPAPPSATSLAMRRRTGIIAASLQSSSISAPLKPSVLCATLGEQNNNYKVKLSAMRRISTATWVLCFNIATVISTRHRE